MPRKNNIPVKYYILNPDDIIKEGDEMNDVDNNDDDLWIPVKFLIGKKVGQMLVRRLLPQKKGKV